MKKALVIIIASIIYFVAAFCTYKYIDNKTYQIIIVAALAAVIVFIVAKICRKK